MTQEQIEALIHIDEFVLMDSDILLEEDENEEDVDYSDLK